MEQIQNCVFTIMEELNTLQSELGHVLDVLNEAYLTYDLTFIRNVAATYQELMNELVQLNAMVVFEQLNITGLVVQRRVRDGREKQAF